jgi:hypothetical protein
MVSSISPKHRRHPRLVLLKIIDGIVVRFIDIRAQSIARGHIEIMSRTSRAGLNKISGLAKTAGQVKEKP